MGLRGLAGRMDVSLDGLNPSVARGAIFVWLRLLGIGTLVALIPNASFAQLSGVTTTIELDGNRLAISPDEMKVLSDIGSLIESHQEGALNRALVKAHRIVDSRDGRYSLAIYELEIGRRRGDNAMRAQALDFLIASGQSPKSKLPGQLSARGQIAFQTGDFEKADTLWTRLAELTPTDPSVFANLAQVKLARKDAQSAYDLLTRAITMSEAVTPSASENWYRQRLSITQQGRLAQSGVAAALALVNAYPSPANWRAAMVVYRDLTAPSGASEIDLLRFMRYAGVFTQPTEYQRMAQLLKSDGAPTEAKGVLNEGVVRGLLDAGTSPTREIIAEIDRAIAKPRVGSSMPKEIVSDAGGHVRLAFARLQAGRTAEAEAEFRAAADNPAGGPYRDLAFFWLTYLKKNAPVPIAT